MNKELKTKLVLASVLAGFSSLASAMPITTQTETVGGASVRKEIVVSKAAQNAIQAKVLEARARLPWGQFIESGPSFVQSVPPPKKK